MKRIILALFLSGCSLGVQIDPPANRFVHNCPYPSERLRLAAVDLEYMWLEDYGESVAGYTDEVNVQCVPGTWSDGERDISGQTDSPNHIRINYLLPGSDVAQSLRYTAYWHELVHIILWRRDGDPDPYHEAPYFDLESRMRARWYGQAEQCDTWP